VLKRGGEKNGARSGKEPVHVQRKRTLKLISRQRERSAEDGISEGDRSGHVEMIPHPFGRAGITNLRLSSCSSGGGRITREWRGVVSKKKPVRSVATLNEEKKRPGSIGIDQANFHLDRGRLAFSYEELPPGERKFKDNSPASIEEEKLHVVDSL